MAARPDQKKKVTILWSGLLFCVLCIFILVFLLVRADQKYKHHISSYEQILARQANAEEQSRRENLMQVMARLFERADREIEQTTSRKLSAETIDRMAILSNEFAPGPYTYIEDDSLSEDQLIPERGLLLKTLLAMRLDSGTWKKVKEQVTFAKAGMAHANLRGTDLTGAKLTGAHLKGADLRDAVLDSADLRGSNLWGAKLQRISAQKVMMNRADLRWANLDSADLENAELNGTKCTNMKMRKAGFQRAQLRHANALGSLFNLTDFTDANLFGTNFSKANFSAADLENVNFRSSNLSGTLFLNARMDGAYFRFTGVDVQNWFDRLDSWEVKGVPGIREKYRVFRDSSGVTNFYVHPIKE